MYKKSNSYLIILVAVISGLVTILTFLSTLVNTPGSIKYGNMEIVLGGSNKETTNNQSQTTTLSQLQSQIEQLSADLISYKSSSQYSSKSADLKSLDSRITKLETDEGALSSTILENPDKALTARYLRDKQTELETEVQDIKNNQQKINDNQDKVNQRIDGIITTLIIVPLSTFVLTLLGSLALLIYNTYYSKKQSSGHKGSS